MKINVSNLAKRYGEQLALKGFSLNAIDFKCLAFIGPSGGGKSTALRQLCGLETPDSGTIKINDTELSRDERQLFEYRKSIGIVFQSYNLFPHLSALKNITLPLVEVHGMPEEEAKDRAIKILTRFELKDHAHKKPSELSGGQSQRVAIARALAPNPDILFLDEPTSALDPEMTSEVLQVIEDLIVDGKKVVLVTHEMGFARKAADQIAFIGQGKVIEHSDAASLFSSPKSETTEKFLKNVLKY